MPSKLAVKTVSKEIKDAIDPLLKWVAVHHAIERGDSNTLLRAQFPWLNLVDDSGSVMPSLTHENIPSDALQKIWKLCKLAPDQVDTIMSLVSCAENGSSNWPLFYNYIELGPDAVQSGRGYTTTIFGACSGTGSLRKVFHHLKKINPNHPLVTKYYDGMMSAAGGSVEGIEGLAHVGGDPTKAVPDWSKWTKNGRTHLDHIEGDLATLPLDDQEWRLAVWRAFIDLNWVSAEAFCSKTEGAADRPGPVITSAIGKGIMVDTSLNHGNAYYWKESPTWTIVFQTMGTDVNLTDEKAWLTAFLKARKKVLQSGIDQLDWSKSGSRCDIWLDLLDKENMTLSRPIAIHNSSATPHPIWPDGLILE